jgi:hypothetical protein
MSTLKKQLTSKQLKKEKCSTAQVLYTATLFFLPTAPNLKAYPIGEPEPTTALK